MFILASELLPFFITMLFIVLFSIIIAVLTRYRKCSSDQIMVIYGKVGKDKDGGKRSSKCIHGGAAFIWPIFQSYEYLDLTPISIQVDLKNALSRQNIRIDVPSRFTVGISTEPGIMQNAAERLLGLKLPEIQELAKDIIFGQLRLVVATMNIEEINTDRDKFLDAISRNVEGELKKIGLRLINVNMTDITDESGYIVALGQEAAARAINEAKVSVAEADRNGSIGAANAQQEQRIKVAEAEATAVSGENESKAKIADSIATLKEREAEALRRSTAAEKINEAKALQDAYRIQKEAELERAAREEATLKADVLVKVEIEKQKLELEAEAKAEQIRRIAKGEADALYAKLSAEAKGIQEMLSKQAEGLKEIVDAAKGSPTDAVNLIIADKLETLVKAQVDAVKNIKIDKITVWDSMNGKDGSSTTSNFMSSMMKSVPPLNDLFSQAGLNLPSYLKGDDTKKSETINTDKKEKNTK